MEFILKWDFSCRTWVRWSMHSFISFTYRSLGNSIFDRHYPPPLPKTPQQPTEPPAEGDSAHWSFLLSVLHDANRTRADDYQGRDLSDPFCIFAVWEVGAWPGLFVWSSTGWTPLITGQCHFWMLSKGLGWGSDCKIRPLLPRREPADESEGWAEVASGSTWADGLMIANKIPLLCSWVHYSSDNVWDAKQSLGSFKLKILNFKWKKMSIQIGVSLSALCCDTFGRQCTCFWSCLTRLVKSWKSSDLETLERNARIRKARWSSTFSVRSVCCLVQQ